MERFGSIFEGLVMVKYNQKFPAVKWFRSEIQTELLKHKINNDLDLYRVFKDKRYVTEMVDRDIEFRMSGGEDNWVTIYIIGQTGTFKSSMSQSIALRHDKTGYDCSRICFSYDELQQGIVKSLPKQFFTLDDQTRIHGTGARRVIDGIETNIETLRKRGNSLTFISPEMKYFDENIFTFVFETIDSSMLGVCTHNNKLHEVRNCKCYMEKKYQIKECYVRAIVKQNGVYIGFYECPIFWGNQLWKEYSVKKDEFIKRVTQQTHNSANYEQLAEQLLEDPENEKYRNKKQITLFVEKKLPYLTIKESELVIECFRMLRKQREDSPIQRSDSESEVEEMLEGEGDV
jgi:hypothetical protein